MYYIIHKYVYYDTAHYSTQYTLKFHISGEANCFGHFLFSGSILTRGFGHTGLGQDCRLSEVSLQNGLISS